MKIDPARFMGRQTEEKTEHGAMRQYPFLCQIQPDRFRKIADSTESTIAFVAAFTLGAGDISPVDLHPSPGMQTCC